MGAQPETAILTLLALYNSTVFLVSSMLTFIFLADCRLRREMEHPILQRLCMFTDLLLKVEQPAAAEELMSH